MASKLQSELERRLGHHPGGALVQIDGAAFIATAAGLRTMRRQLRDLIDSAIVILDLADGEIDAEDSESGSTFVDDRGRLLHPEMAPPWQDEDCEDTNDAEAVNEDGSDSALPLLPTYAVDQTSGPINYREGRKAWQADQLGLERSPSGGWRRREP